MNVPGNQPTPIEYPSTQIVKQVDVYHGVSVEDPYRWLEDDVRDSKAVRDWVTAQNEVTDGYLDALPGRSALKARLRAIWDHERFGVPVARGGRYFQTYNDGLMNQDVVLMQAALDADAEIVFDPNDWSVDGTIALAGFWPDPTGRYVAYLEQDGGSDWRTARIRDLASGDDLVDGLEWLKFTGLSWAADGSGFFYSRYPDQSGGKFQALNTNHAVYFHRVGDTQADDALVYTDPAHPDWGYSAEVTDDGRFLVVTVWLGTDDRYQIVVRDLAADGEPFYLVRGFEHDYALAGSDDHTLYFRTNCDAPNGQVVAIDARAPNDRAVVIPERGTVLQSASLIGGSFVVSYLEHAATRVRVHDLDGRVRYDVELPGIGTAEGFTGRADEDETFYLYSSLDHAPATYRLSVPDGEQTLLRSTSLDADLSAFEMRQVFYESGDGTRVPMFIAHRRGLKLDGSNPTVLYGYGGFNISLTPTFSVTRLAWLEHGGVFAIANLRGGGEYGESWHKAGTRLQKQNVFDDFISAAEYLTDAGYTSPAHLAAMGGSNGGLLVGAVINQRPDLFAAALPIVGVMDMLRFHQFTAGRFWVDDYGSAEDEQEFAALHAYSPYHNLQPRTYPAVLVATADTDDRVVPGHSFKYAARLQAMQRGAAPALIRIETRAGHGAGTPTEKLIGEYADYWSFLLHHVSGIVVAR